MAAAVMAIRRKKERERLQQIEVFKLYDADDSGTVCRAEMILALKDLKLDVAGPLVSGVIDRYLPPGDESAKTDLDGFIRCIADVQKADGEQGHAACYQLGSYFPLFRGHETAKKVYTNNWVQLVVAILILTNFIVNCVEKEIDPFPQELQVHKKLWDDFDTAFNIIFALEIVLNAWGCGGPYLVFWRSGWNVFDFIVVVVGLTLMTGAVPPDSPLSNLKMLRAFRVFRLFKRIKSLNKVITALLRAIPGVSNAFIIMLIFMMIYAILAVEYFAQVGQPFGDAPYSTYITFDEFGNHSISAETARGLTYGYEYYGSFSKALYTLFQVMTGESWSEAVVRPLMFGNMSAALVGLYFVSFILLMQIVLTNVVVAVLLDKFVEEEEPKEEEAEGEPAPELPTVAAMSIPQWPPPPAAQSQEMVDSFAGMTDSAKLTLLLGEMMKLNAAVNQCQQDVSSLRQQNASQKPWTPTATNRERPEAVKV